jgi:hypothetical protein
VNERERAEAVAAFLAWPGPRAGAVSGPGIRTHALASLVAVAIGCALAACSFMFPLVAGAGQPWSAGTHLLLFCHLIL